MTPPSESPLDIFAAESPLAIFATARPRPARRRRWRRARGGRVERLDSMPPWYVEKCERWSRSVWRGDLSAQEAHEELERWHPDALRESVR